LRNHRLRKGVPAASDRTIRRRIGCGFARIMPFSSPS
jgi:hypothetical protein